MPSLGRGDNKSTLGDHYSMMMTWCHGDVVIQLCVTRTVQQCLGSLEAIGEYLEAVETVGQCSGITGAIQLDWSSETDTLKINLPRDREGYDGSKITYEKLSARRTHLCRDPSSIFVFGGIFEE